MRQSSLVILLAGAAVQAFPATEETGTAWKIGQPVRTTSGEIIGHEAPWPENSGVSEYLGIPFGQPPVGDLRFEKPVPFKGSGPISGEKFVSNLLNALE